MTRYNVDLTSADGKTGQRVTVEAADEPAAIEQARAWLAENHPALVFPLETVTPTE